MESIETSMCSRSMHSAAMQYLCTCSPEMLQLYRYHLNDGWHPGSNIQPYFDSARNPGLVSARQRAACGPVSGFPRQPSPGDGQFGLGLDHVESGVSGLRRGQAATTPWPKDGLRRSVDDDT